MSLAPGTRLGPYQLVSLIGAGGMGEVYRARDTKLNREVALKVLPEAYPRGAERMARFKREAQVLASLNHANIAAVYGLEEDALVMELVEGEALSSPLPIDTALRYAKQIAEALEYAHERGVIYRDLKPANLQVTSEGIVKLLDFGLAKAIENPAAPDRDPLNSPTVTLGVTHVGAILGTAAYMSPEQVAGKSADRRADIWSFGAVLYELLSGKPAFAAESVADTLANVLKREPDLNALPASTPVSIRRLVRRCLAKDRKQRLQAIGEARIGLEAVLAGAPEEEVSATGAVSGWRFLPWIAAAAVLAIVAAVGWWTAWRSTRPVDNTLVRLSVDLGPDAIVGGHITAAISSDGTRLAFPAHGPDGKTLLATRLLDQRQATLLPGTEGADDPFFSPDGQWIGFFAKGRMKKVSVRDNAVVVLCDAPDGKRLAFSEQNAGMADLWTLPLDTRDPEHPIAGKPELYLRSPFKNGAPSFSPDGRWISYSSTESGRGEVFVRPYPGGGASGSGRWLISTDGGGFPMWSRNGRELFYETLDNRIMAARYTAIGNSFACEKPRLFSKAQLLDIDNHWNFDVAPDGRRFVVVPRADSAGEPKRSVHVTFLLNFFDEVRRRVSTGR